VVPEGKIATELVVDRLSGELLNSSSRITALANTSSRRVNGPRLRTLPSESVYIGVQSECMPTQRTAEILLVTYLIAPLQCVACHLTQFATLADLLRIRLVINLCRIQARQGPHADSSNLSKAHYKKNEYGQITTRASCHRG
jgi:hypothetical protein